MFRVASLMRTFLILIWFLVVGGFLVGMMLGALGVSDASAHMICGLVGALIGAVGVSRWWGRRRAAAAAAGGGEA